jgi:hypothetical protein
MPTLVLHGDSDVALGEELLEGIEAAVPDVSILKCNLVLQLATAVGDVQFRLFVGFS